MSHVENVLSEYLRATDEQVSEGMHWYDGAHNLALELTPGDPWKGAGILAAFSPNTRWSQNVTLAKRLVENGGTLNGGTLGNSIRAAERIYNGEHPLVVFGGDKTRAFAAAIADPAHSTIATIDRHAHDIAMGRVFTDTERKIGKVVFRTLSSAYVEASQLAGISVAQMQAITWVSWRVRKGIK